MQEQDYTGLAAVAWEFFAGDEPGRDEAFFARILQERPGRALDVGCGTGRLLLGYLGAGHAIDGVEPSADMRAILMRNAEAAGLAPVIHDQLMQDLDLPRTYQTILVPCGSFQLVVDRGEALETLRRFRRHLEPGGLLVLIAFNMLGILRASPVPNGEWGLRAQRAMAGGISLEKHARLDGIDTLDQVLRSTLRYRRVRGDEVLDELQASGDMRWYFMHELTLMLELAGFTDVRVTGNYSEDAPTAADELFAFFATR